MTMYSRRATHPQDPPTTCAGAAAHLEEGADNDEESPRRIIDPPSVEEGGDSGVSSTAKRCRRPQRNMIVATFLAFVGIVGTLQAGRNYRSFVPLSLNAARRLNREPVSAAEGFDKLLAMIKSSHYSDDKERERALVVAKDKWSECVTNVTLNTAIACKNLIDDEVVTQNTNHDKFIRAIIVGKRNVDDDCGNCVVVYMDDFDRALGRDGDGQIYYDFLWESSGREAPKYKQKQIPPIIAEEIISGPVTEDSVEVYIVPERKLGIATNDAMLSIDTTASLDLYGGIKVVDTATSTPEGEAALDTELAKTAIVETTTRNIGPWNCTGMSGPDCCLMIKHKIRDSDNQGRAIQCYLDYAEGTEKQKAYLNARGKKVFIFENGRGRISKEPKVVGDWPKGIGQGAYDPGLTPQERKAKKEEFNSWIEEGGGLSPKQYNLIRKERGKPENGEPTWFHPNDPNNPNAR